MSDTRQYLQAVSNTDLSKSLLLEYSESKWFF